MALDKHKTHLLGTCFYNEALKLCYVNIPKNASTSIKVALGNDWKYSNYIDDELNVENYFTVLRDPLDRYVSALNMMVNQHRYNWDEHVEGQSYFITPLINSGHNITYLKFNENVLSDISKHFDLNLVTNIRRNASARYMVALNHYYECIIRDRYWRDYELINRTNFTNDG